MVQLQAFQDAGWLDPAAEALEIGWRTGFGSFDSQQYTVTMMDQEGNKQKLLFSLITTWDVMPALTKTKLDDLWSVL